jgi:hypothetical protein
MSLVVQVLRRGYAAIVRTRDRLVVFDCECSSKVV